jgi:uncharacterized membrane protein YhaH (DUF805 family)
MIKILYDSLTKKYFQFSGRASRKEYWILYLFTFCITYSLVFFKSNQFVMLALFLIFCIPYITVSIRRLHDLNLNGFLELLILILMYIFLLIKFTQLANIISLFYGFILGIVKGTPTTNKYGEPPLN